MIREFRLSPAGRGCGVSCDANGAFVGAVPLLKRSRLHGNDHWEARNCQQLSKQLSSEFGLPIDLSSKMAGLDAVARALSDGDIARAQIATVLLAMPEPPALSKSARPRSEAVKLIRDLYWSDLLKWDPDEHPRWAAGAADSQGGQFAPKSDSEDCGRNAPIRRRWERAEGKDWPVDAEGRRYDVSAVRDGDFEGVYPVTAARTEEHADMLKRRLAMLRQDIIPEAPSELINAPDDEKPSAE